MQLTKKEIDEALNERHSQEVQQKLAAGNVAIAGLGGLGSNVAFALARIGVGHLHLIDFCPKRSRGFFQMRKCAINPSFFALVFNQRELMRQHLLIQTHFLFFK